jgi:co-chaperonin GroES (HSP10)
VKVGDTVIFPWTAGREVTLDDGPPYLMMAEADILAVLE